jgi:hydrogenase nickel insertion protein HypA
MLMMKALVQATIESALRRANQTGAPSIRGCTIALGELVQVSQEAFRAEWRGLARGTPLEDAGLHIYLLPAEMQCMTCFRKYRPADPDPVCPQCGGLGAKVLSGEACYVESIELD